MDTGNIMEDQLQAQFDAWEHRQKQFPELHQLTEKYQPLVLGSSDLEEMKHWLEKWLYEIDQLKLNKPECNHNYEPDISCGKDIYVCSKCDDVI